MAAEQSPGPPPQRCYPIGGVRVMLPVKPYPCQLAMMAKIINGLKKGQNCLLESPTGSGKSLALLCSTLAWQREQMEKAGRYNALLDAGITDPDVLAQAAGIPLGPPRPTPGDPEAPRTPQAARTPQAPQTPETPKSNPVASGGGFFYEDDDDFRSQDTSVRMPEDGEDESMDLDESFVPMDFDQPQRPRRLRVPKVFLGTRTHKQVEQIVKELRRTAYKDINMVVLSSREHTCIHPIVSVSSNKNEQCQDLTDPIMGVSCKYHHGVSKIKTYPNLAQCGGLQGAWDIEDLVQVGHKVQACPYFTARALLASAELVICPYNYLVDPSIRETMDISLKNHVLVLDEAHNIEDSSREGASCTITQEEILEATLHVEQRKGKREARQKLASMLSVLSGWMDENSTNLDSYTEYGRSGKIFTGTEIIAHFDNLGIGRDSYRELQKCHQTLEEIDPENDEVRLHPIAKKVLGSFFLVYHFLLKDSMKYVDDYRVALIKQQVMKKSGNKLDGWISGRPGIKTEYSINFWCLNPAVAFSPISLQTHSIILTSGTLSPMTSFQSELGVSFKIQLEANHVIDHNQIFVGTVGHGPGGKPLCSTYQHADTWEFQDELGALVLNVCRTVPGGILCFLPSYSMLNKLWERWQSTGVWDEISNVKEAMTEQKKGSDFQKDLLHFYSTIRNAQMEAAGGINGVFLMAVHRGKVSEGLDFSDSNARAVIAVGIPFPNIKDIQVDLKKKYNNYHCRSRKLLSGSEWYEIQAYRAINQALGRCIRHRYDWGALILVDKRFQVESLASGKQENRYTRGLSKWIRTKVVHHRSFSGTMNNLQKFVKNMLANPPSPPKSIGEALLAAPHESTKEKNGHHSLPHENRTSSLEATEPAQAFSTAENCASKPVQSISTDESCTSNPFPSISSGESCTSNPFPSISTAETSKENTFVSHKECNATVEESPHLEKSGVRCGSATCGSDKEYKDLPVQAEKRLHTIIDEPDLDDFNLTLSPVPWARKPSPPLRKRVRKKQQLMYELE